jgi:hypothetical protein
MISGSGRRGYNENEGHGSLDYLMEAVDNLEKEDFWPEQAYPS